MDKEEYYKRIEEINNRFNTDRVSDDEEYQLVCQRNYLSTKYIKNLEQQCKKQKEVIDKAIETLEKGITFCENDSQGIYDKCNIAINRDKRVLDILKEVSE